VELRASAPNNSEGALNANKKISVMVLKSRRIGSLHNFANGIASANKKDLLAIVVFATLSHP
jgi:hypothetical protein